MKDICYGCFELHTPDHYGLRFCSEKCRNLVKWEEREARLLDTGATDRQLEIHRRNHPKYRVKRQLGINDTSDEKAYAETMRSLREERVAESLLEKVDLDMLIERDGGVCHICGMKVDKRKKPGSRTAKRGDMSRYPTVDHIVPISRGGETSWSNVKLAHLSCNSRRGAKGQYP